MDKDQVLVSYKRLGGIGGLSYSWNNDLVGMGSVFFQTWSHAVHPPSQKTKFELLCTGVLLSIFWLSGSAGAAPAKSPIAGPVKPAAPVTTEEDSEAGEDEGSDSDETSLPEDSGGVDDGDGGEESEDERLLDEDSLGPAAELSELELLELEALEQLERSDGLASTVRIRTLRRKRARLAKRAKIRSEVEHVGHSRVAVGFLGTGLASLRKGEEPAGLLGLGGLVEFSVVHGELELEISTRALFEEEAVHVPIELLLKKPWDVKNVRFFLGVGPALVLEFETPSDVEQGVSEVENDVAEVGPVPPGIHFGFASVAGMTWKFRPRVGLTVEMNYNIVIEGGATHELGVSTGLVFSL
jgi:hypothetical protein